MLTNILIALTDFITHTISHLGYFGVACLMAIESAAIPLPSEVIMPFAGFLVDSGRFSLLSLALAGAIGSTVGSFVTYYLGYHGGVRLIKKYEHYVHVSEGELGITEKFFAKFGTISTFYGRMLPVIRTFISIPAGIAKVPIGSFLGYAFLGSFIWSFFLAWLGQRLGQHWHDLELYFRKLDIVIVLIIVFGLIFWLKKYFKPKKD